MNRAFAFLSALIVVAMLLTGQGHPVAQADATMALTAAATVQAIDLGNGLTLGTKQSQQLYDIPPLTAKISQPVLTGTTTPNADTFNKTVSDMLTKTVSSFKDEVTSITLEATGVPNTLPASNITITYEALTANSALLSIKFNVYFYVRGAAHPSSYSMVINYDLTAGKVLALADLFKPNAKYLEALSAYSLKTLKAADRLDFPEGANPIEENYKSWNITATGIQINFDDYQVTSHAAGPQVVIVPYATLKDIIDPKGVLAAFVK